MPTRAVQTCTGAGTGRASRGGGSCALIGNMTTNQIEAESERLLLTVPEAAERLAVGRSTIYELTATGELEVVHIGRCARIPVASLAEFVRRKRDLAATKR